MSLVSPLEFATQDDCSNCCWFFVPNSLSIVYLSVPFISKLLLTIALSWGTVLCHWSHLTYSYRELKAPGDTLCQWLGRKIMKTQHPPLRMELTLRCIYTPHIPWGTKLKPCSVGLCMNADSPWCLPLSCSAFLIPLTLSPGSFSLLNHLAYKAFSLELLFSHS